MQSFVAAGMGKQKPAAAAAGSAFQQDVTLADLVRAAPRLLEHLSAASLKSLLGTSSDVRLAVRDHVRVLRAIPSYPSEVDVQLLARSSWKRLELLDLGFTHLDAGSMSHLRKAHLPLLRHLNVAGTVLSARAVKQLSRGHWPRLETLNMGHTISLVKPAIQYFSNANWPALRSLHLPSVGLKAGAVANLASLSWSRLQHLDLSFNSMEVEAIAQLAHGNWPQLTSLDMSGNVLTTAAITALCKAAFPRLERLDVQSCELNVDSVPQLLSGQWPRLDSLNVAYNQFWAPPEMVLINGWWQMVEVPMTTPWPGLKRLNMKQTGLCSVTRAVLQSWSTLEELCLDWNPLWTGYCADLVHANLPCLKRLSLESLTQLYGADVSSIAQSNWSLESVSLGRSGVSMYDLTTIQWPQLRFLHLADINFDSFTAESLIYGQWPQLEVLTLDQNFMSANETLDCLKVLVQASWPLQLLSMKDSKMNSQGVEFLMQSGWRSLQTLILPQLDYSKICKGHAAQDTLQHNLTHVCELDWLCDCALPQLTRLTFCDENKYRSAI